MMARGYLAGLLVALALLLGACGGKTAAVPQARAQDQLWQRSMQTGLSAYQQGQYQLASQLFRRALERGRQMDRSVDIADAAFNLAAADIQLGNFETAGSALLEAKNESLRLGADLSDIRLLEARLARLQSDSEQARKLTQQLLEQLSATERRLRPQALLLSGLLACEAEDISMAKQQLETALSLLDKSPHPAVAATRAELQGCLELLRGQPLTAAEAFDRQSVYLRKAQQYRQMVNALHQAGSAYSAAQEERQAADYLYRAARSAFSQQRFQLARQLLEKAERSAHAAAAGPLLEEIVRLREEITESSARAAQPRQ